MKIHILQHEPHENGGHILDWAAQYGHKFVVVDARAGAFPNPEDIEFLIILGGALNTNQEDIHPWLRAEKSFIKQTTQMPAPILGICLGSQLLAEALGVNINENKVPEIGWHDIEFHKSALKNTRLSKLSLPTKALEWHGQTFEIPPNGVCLASTEYCINQAFYANDRHIGLQFHSEWTKEITEAVAVAEPMEPNGMNIQYPEEILAGDFDHMRPFLFDVLDHMAALT